MVSIASKVYTIRTERGWTQQELATRSGLTPDTLSRIERGSVVQPNAKTLKRLADAFEIPVVDLIDTAPVAQPPSAETTDRESTLRDPQPITPAGNSAKSNGQRDSERHAQSDVKPQVPTSGQQQ